MKKTLILFFLMPLIGFGQDYFNKLDTMIELNKNLDIYIDTSTSSDDLTGFYKLYNAVNDYYEEQILPNMLNIVEKVREGDTSLLKKYIEFYCSSTGSASEALVITLAQLYLMKPNFVIKHAKFGLCNKFGANYYDGLSWGLMNIYCGEISDWTYFDKMFENMPESYQDSLFKYYPRLRDRYKK